MIFISKGECFPSTYKIDINSNTVSFLWDYSNVQSDPE